MTRRQFLKKSRKALQKTTENLLSLMQIIEKEGNQTINPETAYWKLDVIREDIESIFFEYEKINPPLKCLSLHRKIVKLLIMLQEVIVTNQNYLELLIESSPQAKDKYDESVNKLENFRNEFRILNQKVKNSLKKK